MPEFLAALIDKGLPHCPSGSRFNQCIVTYYPANAGIGWHTDAPRFGECIMAISLGGEGCLQFRPNGTEAVSYEVPAASGSLYVMHGPARWDFQHQVVPVESEALFANIPPCGGVIGCLRLRRKQLMHHLKSLREYIDQLNRLGEIQEIDVEVDWHLEMGAIIRRACELRAPAPLFNRIKGIERGFRVLAAPAGVSRRNGLARVALSLGLPAGASAREMVETLAEAHRKPPIRPRRVPDGPCKENKLLGKDVDLWRLPAPLIHDGDGGRYLNTWGTIVARTPDGKWTNWAISRVMVTGKDTLAGLVLPQQHLGIIHAQWKALDRPMPFALALGTEPAIPFVSGMPLESNVDEADFLGGYFGEPVDVVDCETVDLQVPATSEIVIEGTISVQELALEGPMGEYSGYLSPGGGMPHPVFHVTAMTYRHQPILPVVAAGEPIEENHTCWGLTVSAQVLWELRQAGFPVAMCFCPFQSATHWLVVTVDRSFRGKQPGAPVEAVRRKPSGSSPDGLRRTASTGALELARTLGETLFRSRCGSFIPKVILLDDDIDPTDLDEVVWAFATRCHPQRDLLLFPNQPVLPLVAFLTREERSLGRATKAVYNGLTPDDLAPEELPRRSSFRHLWPREIQEKVLRNWNEYGYS